MLVDDMLRVRKRVRGGGETVSCSMWREGEGRWLEFVGMCGYGKMGLTRYL
jgi:hypothetical protein